MFLFKINDVEKQEIFLRSRIKEKEKENKKNEEKRKQIRK